MRLRFELTKEAIYRLRDQKPLQNLDEATTEALWATILTNLDGHVWVDRASFLKALDKALKNAGVKVGAPVKKATVAALGERDEEAEILSRQGRQPEPDTGLRDHELVPLDQDWRDYFAREVSPFVSDAWVDESHRDATDGGVGRVGYEINFNRYFYRYVPPRPLEEIDSELKLKEVVE